jgi:hypothetical protein
MSNCIGVSDRNASAGVVGGEGGPDLEDPDAESLQI